MIGSTGVENADLVPQLADHFPVITELDRVGVLADGSVESPASVASRHHAPCMAKASKSPCLFHQPRYRNLQAFVRPEDPDGRNAKEKAADAEAR